MIHNPKCIHTKGEQPTDIVSGCFQWFNFLPIFDSFFFFLEKWLEIGADIIELHENGLFIDVTLIKRSAWNMIRMLKWFQRLFYFYRSISFINIWRLGNRNRLLFIWWMNVQLVFIKKRILIGFLISVRTTEKKHISPVINFDRFFVQRFEI